MCGLTSQSFTTCSCLLSSTVITGYALALFSPHFSSPCMCADVPQMCLDSLGFFEDCDSMKRSAFQANPFSQELKVISNYWAYSVCSSVNVAYRRPVFASTEMFIN